MKSGGAGKTLAFVFIFLLVKADLVSSVESMYGENLYVERLCLPCILLWMVYFVSEGDLNLLFTVFSAGLMTLYDDY